MPNCFSSDYKSPYFMQNAIIEELLEKTDDSKRILVVVDALKELPVNLLEFILRRFTTRERCTVRLLGVKPYLNIPLSSKAWSDIWSLKMDDLSNLHELQNDPKYQKVRRLVELCYNYGVVPEIKSETGYSLRLRIIEQISSLHATLVVFVRHCDKKSIHYYTGKIPCHIVVMNNGKMDLFKKGKRLSGCEVDNNSTHALSESPCSSTTQSLYSGCSEKITKFINRKAHSRRVKSM